MTFITEMYFQFENKFTNLSRALHHHFFSECSSYKILLWEKAVKKYSQLKAFPMGRRTRIDIKSSNCFYLSLSCLIIAIASGNPLDVSLLHLHITLNQPTQKGILHLRWWYGSREETERTELLQTSWLIQAKLANSRRETYLKTLEEHWPQNNQGSKGISAIEDFLNLFCFSQISSNCD